MGRPRLRAALLAGAVLVTAAPLVSQAIAPHLTCGVKQTGRWERIPVDNFAPITGISGSQADSVAAYTVDEDRPQDVAATNGYTVLLSRTHGCAWKKSFDLSAAVTGGQPFVGGASRIVSLALLKGRAMAAVQEGSGAGSRPHVLVSDSGDADTWTTRDNGLPAQGAPRLLRAAADGRTAYLTISPTASGGSDDGTTTGIIPGLPGGGETPTGFLYRTVDGGGTWTLQTGPGELPGGGTGFSHLDLDPVDSQRLYGIVGGRLVTSRDGGASFFTAPGSGYTALTATGSLELVAFNAAGGHRSFNGGASFLPFPAPAGITSAAARSGHSGVAIESSGTLRLVEPGTGQTTSVPPPGPARTGSLLGDRGTQSSFHAVAGHSLLRYVDPIPKGSGLPPIAIGDVSVPPPLPGVVVPRARNVKLTVGESSLENFTLELPKNPTPLDLFFLVDVSKSMSEFIVDLQDNLRSIVSKLEADGIDLKVGVGLVGTGPTKGETDYPPDYVYPPQPNPNDPTGSQAGKAYTKPAVYKRLRAIGDTGADLQTAIDRLKVETIPTTGKWSNSEGQLIALKNVATGLGTQNENEVALRLPSWSTVPQGQGANWRPGADTRRIILLATDEFMQAPFGGGTMGSDEGPGSTEFDPRLNFKPTIAMLRAKQIQVIGLDPGYGAALADLQTVAKGTGSLAPPGGVSCGGLHVLRAGDPLVCTSAENFSAVVSRVLASLTDRQSVQVVPRQRTPVLGALNGKALLGLDVKQPNSAPFQVRVSCIDVPPGSYVQDVDLLLRRTVVGRARVNVTCVKADAATRPRPVTLSNPPPPPAQPVPNAVPPPAPPPPAAQPQVQPQVQTQVQLQPLTAGAMQEQQELQLALALNGTYKEDDPAFNAGQQMAMVDRRKRQEVQALGLLAFAVVACSGLGLARLRARPELGVRRAR